MKVIAKRTNGIIWICLIGLVGLSLELMVSYDALYPIGKVFLVMMIIFFLILLIFQVTRPKEIISLNKSQGTLYLHLDDISIRISSLKSVSLERVRAKGGYYSWGTIILKTIGNEYEYKYVANVKMVADELNRLISIEKIKNEVNSEE